jgi:hypothetical protein
VAVAVAVVAAAEEVGRGDEEDGKSKQRTPKRVYLLFCCFLQ